LSDRLEERRTLRDRLIGQYGQAPQWERPYRKGYLDALDDEIEWLEEELDA
jgi:hypothetical protein